MQPLYKCLNKPFKDRMRQKYHTWMGTGPSEFTPAGKKKAPNRNTVLRWISESWADIPAAMVAKSFKLCGIYQMHLMVPRMMRYTLTHQPR